MHARQRHVLAVTVMALATTALAATPAAGQSTVRDTPWGDPDLQGIWSSSGATPMERPDRYEGRETLSDEEVALLRSDIAARDEQASQPGNQRTQAGGNVGAYNNFWMERGARTNRTSMLVDPPDGRFPPLTPAGKLARTGRSRGNDSWDDRHIWERCVTRGGMPNAMFPRVYNNNMQVFQAPGYVVILLEQVHEVRIIPLDDRPPLPDNIGQWNGNSRGYWDGDTLMVETANLDHRVSALQPWSVFNSKSGSGEGLTLVERFTRVDAGTLEYQVEVNDLQMYTTPWTVAYPFLRSADLMYEYACHEGNVGMEGMLSGGRADDSDVEEAR
jgi:hypothetical protein